MSTMSVMARTEARLLVSFDSTITLALSRTTYRSWMPEGIGQFAVTVCDPPATREMGLVLISVPPESGAPSKISTLTLSAAFAPILRTFALIWIVSPAGGRLGVSVLSMGVLARSAWVGVP